MFDTIDEKNDYDAFLADFGLEARDPADRPVPVAAPAPAPAVEFVEDCPKCHGRGNFIGYSGRIVGKCFKCEGTGKLKFKQSPEVRAAKQASRDRSKAAQNEVLASMIKTFIEEHKAEWDWMLSAGVRFDFAKEMAITVTKKGGLTENQLAAVRRCMLKDVQREERIAAEKAQREQSAQVVNIQPIVEAFAKATEKGVKRPIMRFETFRFSLAPSHGKNAGAIYVKARDGNDTYLGKIVDGKFLTSRDCSKEMETLIAGACANPAEAAIAYGRTSGECSMCGRELTDPASIAAGIGPICAGNYGF